MVSSNCIEGKDKARAIAHLIDPSYREVISLRHGIEFECSCPNIARHAKPSSRMKSFSIRNREDSPFGVVWHCYVCDKKELSDVIFSNYVEVVPRKAV